MSTHTLTVVVRKGSRNTTKW